MIRFLRPAAAALACLAALPAPGETVTLGGDVYVAGPDAATAPASARDLFAAGFSVTVRDPVGADAHLTGFSVAAESEIAGDLYAAGGSVRIDGAVGGDLTAAGFDVTTGRAAAVAGNARLSGGSVTVSGPVSGTLVVSGGEVTLDAAVTGDVRLAAGALSFGPDAQVGGTLVYSAPDPIDVPARVAPASRVRFEPLDPRIARDLARDWSDGWEGPGPFAVIGGALTALVFLVALGAVLLAFLPERVHALRDRALARPGVALLAGAAGLATLFGLVPVSAMTVVGIPLVPFVLLGILAFWTLGYLLGVHAVATRVLHALRPQSADAPPAGIGPEVLALAAGLAVFALLNFVPVLGWIANLLLVFLGLGAMAAALLTRLVQPEADGGRTDGGAGPETPPAD